MNYTYTVFSLLLTVSSVIITHIKTQKLVHYKYKLHKTAIEENSQNISIIAVVPSIVQ